MVGLLRRVWSVSMLVMCMLVSLAWCTCSCTSRSLVVVVRSSSNRFLMTTHSFLQVQESAFRALVLFPSNKAASSHCQYGPHVDIKRRACSQLRTSWLSSSSGRPANRSSLVESSSAGGQPIHSENRKDPLKWKTWTLSGIR